MRALILIGMLACLSGCQSEAQDAEAQLKILEASKASPRELCNAKRKVAEAYLKAHDQSKYEFAKSSADVECTSADLNERYPPVVDQMVTNID